MKYNDTPIKIYGYNAGYSIKSITQVQVGVPRYYWRPATYYIDDMQKWCLIADQYHTHKGYTPFLCNDLSSGEWKQLSPDEFNMGKRKKRHGGVIKITDEQYDKLVETFGIDE